MQQHLVPRAYLKGFTDPHVPGGQEPYLWIYERGGKGEYRRAPQKTAVRKHYYSFRDEGGKRDMSVEAFLGKLESLGMPILKRLAGGDDPSSLSDNDRLSFATFAAALSVRTPRWRDMVERSAAELMGRATRVMASDKESFKDSVRRAISAGAMKEPVDIERMREFILSGEYDLSVNPVFSLAMMVQLIPHITPYLYGYKWRLLETSADRIGFVTSDAPLTQVSTERLPAPYGWGAGWETPWMEATLPLTPKCCLLISLHHPEGREVVSEKTVREVNWRTAAHAGEKVFSSRKLASPTRELDRPRDWEWWQPATSELVPTQPEAEGERP